jgi:hypothetical protein
MELAERKFRVEQDSTFAVGGQEADADRLTSAVSAREFRPAGGRERHRPATNELRQEVPQQTVHRNHPGGPAATNALAARFLSASRPT